MLFTTCKVVIYNYFMLDLISCQIWLLLYSILYIMYSIWDLFVKVVCERESVKTQGNWRLKLFLRVARE